MFPSEAFEVGGRMLDVRDQVVALQQEHIVRVAARQPAGADRIVQAEALRDHRQ
jgi:hypothetical protein